MTNDQIYGLMKAAFDELKNASLARNLFGQLRLSKIPDGKKAGMVGYLENKDEKMVLTLCRSYQDKDAGKFRLLQYYSKKKNAKAGVPLADEMIKIEKYAADSYWIKGNLLQLSRKYAEAIKAYRMCKNEPSNLWKIVDCLVAMGKVPQAISELAQIRNFFPPHAPQAVLRTANIYRATGQKKKQIASLRTILKAYPKSKQSREAHVRLEKMGVRIGGGTDAE
jgi:tetratricopeptide (TPR) repeat protein